MTTCSADLINIAKVVFLSLIPSFEGRYALLVGIASGLDPLTSFAAASVGITVLALVLPNILAYIDEVARALGESGYDVLSKVSELYLRYVGSVRRRVRKYIDKYGALGLIVFVAIPLPATGVWTGSLGAYILGMSKKRAMISLLIGGIASNLITLAAAALLA
ncbi:MAG: COG2426 family protein [Desulfurococcales archaeon]|nr:COG2426 family protein [Desulfurococcales archaeon]